MKPTGNRVLVAEVRESSTNSGLILSRSIETKRAKILEVGPDVKFVQVGEEIYLDWSKGVAVSEGGRQLVIVSEDHILAVLER